MENATNEMDVIEVLKIYDNNNDGYLTHEELQNFENDVDYIFSDVEKGLFSNLNNISYQEVIDAIHYNPIEISKNNLIKCLDNFSENEGKILIPELINILKDDYYFTSDDILDEFIKSIPNDKQYLIINRLRELF